MKKIKIMLSYQEYPVWIYDETNNLIDLALPDELKDNTELPDLCDDIQHTYESLFTNNKIEFSYQGFANRTDELIFMDKLERLVNIVTERVGDQYIVVNDIDEPWRR